MKIPDALVEYSTEESVERIYQFLQSHPAGVLAEVDSAGHPHASVVYFSMSDQFSVYFVTKTNTQKYQNLQINPQAVLVSFHQSTQASAQISGRVREITDIDVSQGIVNDIENIALAFSISGVAPIIKLDVGDYVAYELKPDTIKFAMFLRPDPVTYDSYETLTFKYE